MADRSTEKARQRPQDMTEKAISQNPNRERNEYSTSEYSPGDQPDEHVGVEGDADRSANTKAELETRMDSPPQSSKPSQPLHQQSQRRGHRSVIESDTESVPRSDTPAAGGRRNRQRQRKGRQSGRQLESTTENVPGGEVVNSAGDVVQTTAGHSVDTIGNTGYVVSGSSGGGYDKDNETEEQLRLRLELNLDVEVQLKAKIYGDLTLGLLN